MKRRMFGLVFVGAALIACGSGDHPGPPSALDSGAGGNAGASGAPGRDGATADGPSGSGGAGNSTGGAPNGGSFSTAPAVRITSPMNGATISVDVSDPRVPVGLDVSNFVLRDPARTDGSACPKGTCGHVELLVDDGDGDYAACDGTTDAGKSYNALAASLIGNHIDLGECPSIAGNHTVKADLYDDDGTAVLDADGTVTTSNVVSFTVPPADGGAISGTDAGRGDSGR